MRDIKFRAWDTSLKKYRTLGLNSGKQNLGIGFEVKGGIGSNTTTIYHSTGDIIEQFTGLYDKNGKEIYEGDIVKLHVVILSPDDKVGFIEYRPEFGYCINFGKSIARQEYWAANDKHTIEVIGNIHENPVLLEGK